MPEHISFGRRPENIIVKNETYSEQHAVFYLEMKPTHKVFQLTKRNSNFRWSINQTFPMSKSLDCVKYDHPKGNEAYCNLQITNYQEEQMKQTKQINSILTFVSDDISFQLTSIL